MKWDTHIAGTAKQIRENFRRIADMAGPDIPGPSKIECHAIAAALDIYGEESTVSVEASGEYPLNVFTVAIRPVGIMA